VVASSPHPHRKEIRHEARNVNLMQRNLVAIGEDVGNGLRRF
jgi:hypothetical protein